MWSWETAIKLRSTRPTNRAKRFGPWLLSRWWTDVIHLLHVCVCFSAGWPNPPWPSSLCWASTKWSLRCWHRMTQRESSTTSTSSSSSSSTPSRFRKSASQNKFCGVCTRGLVKHELFSSQGLLVAILYCFVNKEVSGMRVYLHYRFCGDIDLLTGFLLGTNTSSYFKYKGRDLSFR